MKNVPVKTLLSRSYYRLGLAAAKQRYLSAALKYAQCAAVMDSEDKNVLQLEEICRSELYGYPSTKQIPENIINLVKQKKYLKAAQLLSSNPDQSVRCLSMQGCLWALAKRNSKAADCFMRVLEKDRGNKLALQAVMELQSQCKPFWRLF
ncbi:MAG: hypothetical protein Ta2F_15600 [Termitinemataceae bacterium]|nr:MAG: hypothetical protein Ta2F_15600 [Termitinemataceae bacterium]